MRILVSGGTRDLKAMYRRYPEQLGVLITPRNLSRVTTAAKGLGAPWVADNGAFSGFDLAAFRRMLRRIRGKPGCLFVVCPDVVADARATLARFGEWALEVRASGQPVAFVGQDGAEDLDLPWDDFDAWFIGGSTGWKLSQASADLVAQAKRRGLHVHMGRVNSMRRLRAAVDMGCDSCDGSSYSRWAYKADDERPDDLLVHTRAWQILADIRRRKTWWPYSPPVNQSVPPHAQQVFRRGPFTAG